MHETHQFQTLHCSALPGAGLPGGLRYSYTNSWQPQAEMTYDGLGNRLAMTGYADGQSVSTQYVLDQGKVLLATANSQTTAYLYGLGVIGSQTDVWSYLLPDGLIFRPGRNNFLFGKNNAISNDE